MRHFLSRAQPPFDRVLLIESGDRAVFEDVLSGFYDKHPEAHADLITCFAGLPQHFRPERGQTYRVGDYRDRAARKKLYQELIANRYTITIIICAGLPIMTKWKWILAARVPAKLLVVNEN